MEVRSLLEAILFVAEEPLPASELAELLEIPRTNVEEELRTMAAAAEDRGVVLREVGGGWRMYTHPEGRPYLERFAATARATRLSPAALETLAVVAYRQPVSRGQVAEIRGVDSERALRTLERRGIVAEVGKAAGPGQALLYGTTTVYEPGMAENGISGIELTTRAFASTLSWSPLPLSIAAILFAFSTMIAWSYYGLKAFTYLFGDNRVTDIGFKLFFLTFVVLGSSIQLSALVDLSDALVFVVAIPNLLGLYVLAPLIRNHVVDYEKRIRR